MYTHTTLCTYDEFFYLVSKITVPYVSHVCVHVSHWIVQLWDPIILKSVENEHSICYSSSHWSFTFSNQFPDMKKWHVKFMKLYIFEFHVGLMLMFLSKYSNQSPLSFETLIMCLISPICFPAMESLDEYTRNRKKSFQFSIRCLIVNVPLWLRDDII